MAIDVKAIAYMRRSQDSGTGVSEELQDEMIRSYVERRGGQIVRWLPADLDASSWTLERPSMQEARKLLAAGTADTLVVSKLNRITRRRKDWERLLEDAEREGWTIRSADYDLDLKTDVGRLVAGIIIDLAEKEYRERRSDLDDSRRNAVMRHGVHGGATAPLGYAWTTRGYDKKGNAQRGPLQPTNEAARVRSFFERCADSAQDPPSWRQAARMLGVPWNGARKILLNRVYLGEARSGAFVNPGAHPALVSEAVFQRANRRMRKAERHVENARSSEPALLAKILVCESCRHLLTPERRAGTYRCKNPACLRRTSITMQAVEPVVLEIARGWHERLHPNYALTRELEDALLPGLEGTLAAAEAELAEVERMQEAGELTPAAYGKALTLAERARDEARRAVAEAEEGAGWLSLTPGRVEEKLAGADVKTRRSFVAEMVRVLVLPVGRGRWKAPVEQRLQVQYLTRGRTETEIVAPEVARAVA